MMMSSNSRKLRLTFEQVNGKKLRSSKTFIGWDRETLEANDQIIYAIGAVGISGNGSGSFGDGDLQPIACGPSELEISFQTSLFGFRRAAACNRILRTSQEPPEPCRRQRS